MRLAAAMTKISKHPRTNKRRWLFRGMAIAMSLLPFVCAEFLLRFLGLPSIPASDDPLVDLNQLKPLFVQSADGLKWEIPETRFNFFRPESFACDKRENEFRVFVLGGSTVQGRPFATETSFSTWLEIALQTSDESRFWNVINCGGISYASYRLAPILDEVLQHDPDLIIIYSGHNEFLEERTYGHLKTVPRPAAMLSQWLGNLRITQCIRRAIQPVVAPPSSSAPEAPQDPQAERWVAGKEVATRLDIVGGLKKFTRDQSWRIDVIDHYQSTLDRMTRRCVDQGVPLILCVPASDIVDTPPFKIATMPGLEGESLKKYQSHWQLASQFDQDAAARMAACRDVLRIDPHHAGAAFVLGRLLLDAGEIELAKKNLVVARDWDVCTLRAPSEIETIVRETASRYQVPLVDVPERITSISRNGLPSDTHFIDHVHPNIETHQKISLWILETMRSMGCVAADETAAKIAGVAIEPMISGRFSEHLSGLGEDYFFRGRQRLEGLRQWAAGRAGEMSVD
jgi:hypothetical protein